MKLFEYDTLKPVRCASVRWSFKTHDIPSFQTRTHDTPIALFNFSLYRIHDKPSFQTRLTPMYIK